MPSNKMTTTPSPLVDDVLISFPSPRVMLVTLNRPQQLNALRSSQHTQLEALFSWFDAEPTLRCAVVAGAGRAFCAGADLKEWNEAWVEEEVPSSGNSGSGTAVMRARRSRPMPPSGFGGLSNRIGKKPVVAAVHGLCLGGGMEIVLNCDLVVAAGTTNRREGGSSGAVFGLPEVRRGVVALAGALPRLVRTVGRQRAAEMALTGRRYSAEEMQVWGVVNEVVPAEVVRGLDTGNDNANNNKILLAALRLAETIAGNSPDAIIVSREGLRLGWEGFGPGLGTELLQQGLFGRIDGGANMREGVRSFVEKREPVWVDSKL